MSLLMSRPPSALIRAPASAPLSTLARTPEEHAIVESARKILVNGSVAAAEVLAGGAGDKEAIASARDLLDRVGLHANAAAAQGPSADVALSAAAYGAVRALFDHLGLEVNLPDAAAVRVEAVVHDAPSAGDADDSDAQRRAPPVGSHPRARASHGRKTTAPRASRKAEEPRSDDDFIISLEDRG
jgi:hypothetical protein